MIGTGDDSRIVDKETFRMETRHKKNMNNNSNHLRRKEPPYHTCKLHAKMPGVLLKDYHRENSITSQN